MSVNDRLWTEEILSTREIQSENATVKGPAGFERYVYSLGHAIP